ncbi:hypothetical protein HHL11_26775 [Ramlibacter sp. G-1-2-2]|uniref:Uncharacterized protein n=1 Tax=Ramlibacter agri TaxID=2728837 RepID=A0A848HBF2_9BURK|nr:hypothetical protein [Ramlibacter agri]NML47382.1 hypothetical protein [Ramlibacter agri]
MSLACAWCGPRAQEAEAQARFGAVADGVAGFVGVAAGLPLNPLLPGVGLAFKAATFQHAESLPETERPRAYALAAASWQGSAAGNACAAASVLSGGSFVPTCIAVGAAWGWKTWSDSERERRDSERCEVLRAFVGKPKLPCAFMPRGIEQAAAPAQAVVAAQDLVAP